MKYKWLWITLAIIILLIYSFWGYIRSIEITIIDNNTKKPLENVLVYYLLEGRRSELLSFYGPDYRIVTKTLFTDKNGKVYIKSSFFLKYLGEGFYEKIAVNMDTRETKFDYVYMNSGHFICIPKNKSDDPSYNFFSHHLVLLPLHGNQDMVFNPINDYYGFFIRSSDGYNYAKDNAGGNKFVKYEKYTLFWNDYSLGKLFKEKITVELERKKK